MAKRSLLPIILCGGSGTRLWPLSRASYPKQFWNLPNKDDLSLLQKTLQRLNNLENLKEPIIICNEEHRFIAAEQLREIEIKASSIILETCQRNTAPAIAIAALKALEDDEDPILLTDGRHLALSFHPEYSSSFKIYNYFKNIIKVS